MKSKRNFQKPPINYIVNEYVADLYTKWRFMSEDGLSYAEAYHYKTSTSIILSELTVHHEVRKEGRGLELQLIRENLGRSIGCKFSFLWVEKATWMKKWYLKRGYKVDGKKDEKNHWLKMELSKSNIN